MEKEFLRKSGIVRERCSSVKILLDSSFVWNKAIADEISKSSIKTIVQSLLKFTLGSDADGFGNFFDQKIDFF